MAHKITYSELSNPRPDQRGRGWMTARCKCGKFLKEGTRQECEEWEIAHLADVERIKAHLGTRNPTLKTQRDYFREREMEEEDPEKRRLWRQLADELEHRIGKEVTEEDQTSIFDFI